MPCCLKALSFVPELKICFFHKRGFVLGAVHLFYFFQRRRTRTTIKDIADRLGISLSTVSKGLNGANDISEELRQLVLDTAVEMGYQTKKMKKEEFKNCLLYTSDAADEL